MAAPLAGLIYERRGPAPEAWVRCTLERTSQGPRIVLELAHVSYSLAPAPHVLEGILWNLRNITPAELETGRATIGPVGQRALERLRVGAERPRIAA